MRKMKSSAYCLIVIAACAMSNLSFAEDTTPVYWASSRLILFITLYILSNIPHRVYTLTFPPLPPGAGRWKLGGGQCANLDHGYHWGLDAQFRRFVVTEGQGIHAGAIDSNGSKLPAAHNIYLQFQGLGCKKWSTHKSFCSNDIRSQRTKFIAYWETDFVTCSDYETENMAISVWVRSLCCGWGVAPYSFLMILYLSSAWFLFEVPRESLARFRPS